MASSRSRKRPSSVLEEKGETSGALSVEEYRRRLQEQGKYLDRKPGSNSLDGCLHDPPRLPPQVRTLPAKAPVPKRSPDDTLIFKDHPDFKPNLTPQEAIQRGSFGGTYFRDIKSAVTGVSYLGKEVIKEFPQSWFKGLDLDTMVCSPTYSKHVNRFGASCGGGLGQWETSGWISELDPYGWFQWYCRFYLGRRSTDDERQIKRWAAGQGPTGRWRGRVCNDLIRAGKPWDDEKISRVIRQVLQHWAYRLTEADLERHFSKD